MIKSSSLRFFATLSSLLVTALLIAGCDCGQCSQPDVGPITQAPINYYRMAPMMPPQPQPEYVQIPETPRNLLWRPGYWDYDGTHFNWVSGELMARPSPTAIWSPDHWVEHTYGWSFEAGHWQ